MNNTCSQVTIVKVLGRFLKIIIGLVMISFSPHYSEYGETWHKAGSYGEKQNVFDDFCAAAEYLVQNKYTNSNR